MKSNQVALMSYSESQWITPAETPFFPQIRHTKFCLLDATPFLVLLQSTGARSELRNLTTDTPRPVTWEPQDKTYDFTYLSSYQRPKPLYI